MNEWLTTREVAAVLGVNRSTVLRWIAAGRLRAIRIPTVGKGNGHTRINVAELKKITEQEAVVAA